jgi:hypothetical protein
MFRGQRSDAATSFDAVVLRQVASRAMPVSQAQPAEVGEEAAETQVVGGECGSGGGS